MSWLDWGTCSVCGKDYKLRSIDKAIRLHRGCAGGGLPPAVEQDRKNRSPTLPELPPGYEITFSDDNADPQYNGWDIWIRGNIYDGRDEDEEMPQDRSDAVEECWSMWLDHDCSAEWVAYFEAIRGQPCAD